MFSYNKNISRKLVYISCLLISAIYILFFIDSSYFHNVSKIKYSFGKITIIDFRDVLKVVKHDNYLNSKLEVNKGKAYLVIDNFKDVLLDDVNRKVLTRNELHPTQSLALFSMGFLSDYFIRAYSSKTLDDEVLGTIEDTYLFIYNEISNPISLNPMVVNDQVVSERIQFLAMFLSYIKKNHPEKRILLNALSKDFNLLYNLILDREFFTWQTNHGIMQLRSLGQLIGVVNNIEKNKLIKEFESRLNDILPYYLGKDGAVYESATGYWYYIYKQFWKIANTPNLQHLASIKKLNLSLEKTKFFLNCISSNDLYMEGIGDSYSFYLDPSDTIELKQNRYFNFSNNFCGANWSSDKFNYNLLFSSLHTPPNVHKLPDDLMLSIYIKSPFFTNTGIYSYNQSKERLFFKNDENAHTSVSLVNDKIKKPDSSFVKLINYDSINSSATLFGIKYYSDGQNVSREIRIKPRNSIITIRDSSISSSKIKTSFNIHPDTKLEKVSDKEYILTNKDSIELYLSSNHDINIKKTIISSRKERIDTIQKLTILGDNIITKISFEPSNEALKGFQLYNSNFSKNLRLEQSIYLNKKYKNKRSPKGFRSMLLNRFYLVGIVLIVFVFLFEIYLIVKRFKHEHISNSKNIS